MEAARTPQTEAVPAAGEGRPEGPVAAALLATGVGSLVLAILVVIAEANESFAMSLAYDDGVGPLSGKTIWAVVAYAGSWAILAPALRGRRMNLRPVVVAAVLLALALVGTFSPFFEMFKSE